MDDKDAQRRLPGMNGQPYVWSAIGPAGYDQGTYDEIVKRVVAMAKLTLMVKNRELVRRPPTV